MFVHCVSVGGDPVLEDGDGRNVGESLREPEVPLVELTGRRAEEPERAEDLVAEPEPERDRVDAADAVLQRDGHEPGPPVDGRGNVGHRTHDAIKGCCARDLDHELEPMRLPGPTAVIAHRHAWFVSKLAALLDGHGVTVLACTDNGAEALGVIVAEQPDVLFFGDPLAMMTGPALMAETRLYAPGTLLAVQASDPQEADALRAAADAVFLRQHPPGIVAKALVELQLTGASSPGS